MTGIVCPRCIGLRTVIAAGSREPRPCPSCDGRGYFDADRAMYTEDELRILQLEALTRDYEREIARLRAEVARLSQGFGANGGPA